MNRDSVVLLFLPHWFQCCVDFYLLDGFLCISLCLLQITLKSLSTVPVCLLCCNWVLNTPVTVRSGHNIDPANTASPQSCLERVESVLQRHRTLLASTAAEIHQPAASQQQELAALTAQFQQLTAALSQMAALAPSAVPSSATPPPVIPESISEPRVGAPERYAGDPENCNPFLTNCSILFALQPHTFASEEARVAFTINHLTGRARLWGTAEWERRTPACASFQAFATELRKVFGTIFQGPDSSGGLLNLHQGGRSVADYSIDFRTRACQSNWNVEAQCDAYLLDLRSYIKDNLVSYDLPRSLDGLIELTTWLDRRIPGREGFNRRLLNQFRSSSEAIAFTAAPQGGEPELMQVGRTSLTLQTSVRCVRCAVLQSDILWPLCEMVCDPSHQV